MSADGLSVPHIIGLKRDGLEFADRDIKVWVEKVVKGDVSDDQMGAWLMAVYLNGLSNAEISHLTRYMVNCGNQLDWPEQSKHLVVDKHSTGGVGDKISLPLAPALAACGLMVPMVSGRGLGKTGGTLDKLESIPNFRVHLTEDEIQKAVETVGCCIVSQTEKLCPADRKMYKSRDVTGTVGSEGLITSSIISKKVAEGISSLVLDVKWGLGSYNGSLEEATKLATNLRSVAESLGVKTSTVLSHMNSPLGHAVGNSLEVRESIACLRGGGPTEIREFVCLQGAILLLNSRLVNTIEEGKTRLAAVLDDGSALNKFGDMMKFQGVDSKTIFSLTKDENSTVLPFSDHITSIVSDKAGYVACIHAEKISSLAGKLGASRYNPKDTLDPAVGVMLKKSPGDWLDEGEVWAEVHHNRTLHDGEEDLIRGALSLVDNVELVEQRISEICF